jgi:hypothetical protein
MLDWGVSGTHRWRHTSLGMEYRGSAIHYTRGSYYDSTNQTLMLGLTHRFTPHTTFSLRQSTGIFSRAYGVSGVMGLSSTVPFDPVASNIPSSDYFDNRTIFLTSQADFTFQRSLRTSINVGGDTFLVRRRSIALAGVLGATARGDIQYRLSSRSTVGASYNFTHFEFTRGFGGSDMHTARGSYSVRLTRNWEFSGYAGASRVESKFLLRTAIDPVIAALLGITSTVQITHTISTIPNVGGRLAKRFAHGVAHFGAGHDVMPGNGLFLTSFSTHVGGGYTYNGIGRWSITANAVWARSTAVGSIQGDYRNSTENVTISRQIGRSAHMSGGFDLRQYGSTEFTGYRRNVYGMRVGISYSPGDVPLRLR